MPAAVPGTLHGPAVRRPIRSSSPFTDGKAKHREVKKLAPGHTASEQWKWRSTRGHVAPEPVTSLTSPHSPSLGQGDTSSHTRSPQETQWSQRRGSAPWRGAAHQPGDLARSSVRLSYLVCKGVYDPHFPGAVRVNRDHVGVCVCLCACVCEHVCVRVCVCACSPVAPWLWWACRRCERLSPAFFLPTCPQKVP